MRHYSTTKPFEGVINNIERRWRETEVRLGDRGAVALPVDIGHGQEEENGLLVGGRGTPSS